MADYEGLLADLDAEETALDALIRDLGATAWHTPTPATGWDVHDTIAHLAVAEDLAATALTDASAFAARLAELLEDVEASDASLTDAGRAIPSSEVLVWWRHARASTLDELRRREARERVPWITGPMSAMSFATARLMETWAHGQDVADGLAIAVVPTTRLRHVADLGVRTRAFSFTIRGLPHLTATCAWSSTRRTARSGVGEAARPMSSPARPATSASWSRNADIRWTRRSR